METPNPDSAPDPDPDLIHRMLDRLSEPKVRWAIAGGVGVLALGVCTFAVAGFVGPTVRRVAGPEISIAVVPPVEPDIQPGDKMEVGTLNDGFDATALANARAAMRDDATEMAGLEQPAYVATEWDPNTGEDRPIRRVDSRRNLPSDIEIAQLPAMHGPISQGPISQGNDNPRSFGFDAPRPDYEAEREARRTAMLAREDAARREAQARRARLQVEGARYYAPPGYSSAPPSGPAPYRGQPRYAPQPRQGPPPPPWQHRN